MPLAQRLTDASLERRLTSQGVEGGQASNASRLQVIAFALLASVLFWILVWYWPTATSMAMIWWTSDTFAHGLVVYPISLWLIWRRRADLLGQPIGPSVFALVPLAASCFGWLLACLGGVQAAMHFALVAMIVSAVWVVLGTPMARTIMFPLLFTFLAVPIGEFMLPVLMEHTADFTVAALRASGIPVYREGNNFVIPTGSWSVVEACSGLRYLIASMTLGLLYAYLSYRSFWRRLLFFAASVAVPIVANWVRAYLIVMIGHLSGMALAVGVDHLIYGWVFFGIVMLVLFWIGSRWRQDISPEPGAEPAPVKPGTVSPRMAIGALITAAVVALGPVYADRLETTGDVAAAPIWLPTERNGWTMVRSVEPIFWPHYVGARSSVHRVYERDGVRVAIYIGYYVQQREGREMIASGNDLMVTRESLWTEISARRNVPTQSGISVVEARLKSYLGEVKAWQTYWINGTWTVHPQIVKLKQAADTLSGRGDHAAVVVLHQTIPGGDRALATFLRDMTPMIEEALNRMRSAEADRGS